MRGAAILVLSLEGRYHNRIFVTCGNERTVNSSQNSKHIDNTQLSCAIVFALYKQAVTAQPQKP